jgi:hypothetical protein
MADDAAGCLSATGPLGVRALDKVATGVGEGNALMDSIKKKCCVATSRNGNDFGDPADSFFGLICEPFTIFLGWPVI